MIISYQMSAFIKGLDMILMIIHHCFPNGILIVYPILI